MVSRAFLFPLSPRDTLLKNRKSPVLLVHRGAHVFFLCPGISSSKPGLSNSTERGEEPTGLRLHVSEKILKPTCIGELSFIGQSHSGLLSLNWRWQRYVRTWVSIPLVQTSHDMVSRVWIQMSDILYGAFDTHS